MERASIMLPGKKRIPFKRLVIALAFAATLAGCSSLSALNPFAKDDAAQDGTGASDGQRRATDRRSQAGLSSTEPQFSPNRVPLASGHPDEYTVRRGDTLWDIASTFLKDPWYWPEIWYVNPQVENPHLIYPGDVLILMTIDGRQQIFNTRVSTYRLSPQARISPTDESIDSIPYESVAAFLSKGMVLERREARDLAYILAIRGDHMMAAAGMDTYVRGVGAAPTGTRYSIVHVGEKLIDPDNGRAVGYLSTYVGSGALTRGGDPATLSLTDTHREALRGDRLIAEGQDIPLSFFPKAPDSKIDGRIISVVDGVTLIGQYQVIVMNRGARHGLAPGDVLTVYQTGERVRDGLAPGAFVNYGGLLGGQRVKLPDEDAGTVMVFKVYDRIAYGLVMEARSDIHVHDALRNPVR